MSFMTTADAAFAHLEQGPFPGLMDPWAENARYFQQLHSGMIGHLQVQLKRPLFDLGYIIGKETSLQIAEYRQPDLAIEPFSSATPLPLSWDYWAAATAIEAEPGLVTETALAEVDLQALFIHDLQTGSLVTLIEIISPRNKTHWADMLEYQAWRQRMVRQGVNVVEIDLTRSVKRLLDNTLTHTTAYHTAIYLPQSPTRVVPMPYHESLPRVALPLRGEVVPMMLQAAYDAAYRDGLIAGNILKDKAYTLEHLPFPSLLSFAHQQAAMTSVNEWYIQLQALRKIEA
jgi:hypothetical protein